jgi:hypothetical protein
MTELRAMTFVHDGVELVGQVAYDPIADRVSWAGAIALLEATIGLGAN